MLDRIAEFIARHNMLPPGAGVGGDVSGGADSVFLLHALLELAPRWNLHLAVVHIDHGVRGAASRARTPTSSKISPLATTCRFISAEPMFRLSTATWSRPLAASVKLSSPS